MTEKAERYRDFFDLQLRFAEAVAEKRSMPIAEAALLYTNFHRRFGLGDITRDGLSPAWHDYVREFARLGTHDQRAGWTQTFYAQAAEERSALPDHVFGCFEFDANEETGIVRLHFYNRDAHGPLSRARMGERRRELETMFAYIKRFFPAARHVEGTFMALRHECLSSPLSRRLRSITRGDRERQPISGHGMVGTVSGSRRQRKAAVERGTAW
jgi:hypothetical protein